MRIAICDDLPEQIKKIKCAVESFLLHRTDVFFEIESFDKAFDFLDAQEKSNYEIVLLDICMPGLLGTDIAREIRKKRDNTEIIFLTTSDEFALDAFGVNAAHYLLKPFSQVEFNDAMCRALQNIDKKALKTVYFKGSKGTVHAVTKTLFALLRAQVTSKTFFFPTGKQSKAYKHSMR